MRVQGLFTYTAAANDAANNVTAGQIVTVNLFNPAFNTGITAINPIIRNRFLANIPIGNSTQVGDQRNTTGYVVQQVFNPEQTNYTTRLDYIINSKNQLTGTYRSVKQNLLRADIDNTFNANPIVEQPSSNPFLSIGLTSTLTSSFANELRVGVFKSDPRFLRKDTLPVDFINIPLVTNPELSENTAPPGPFLNQGRAVKNYNFQDNATYIFGKNSLRFGGQIQRVKI